MPSAAKACPTPAPNNNAASFALNLPAGACMMTLPVSRSGRGCSQECGRAIGSTRIWISVDVAKNRMLPDSSYATRRAKSPALLQLQRYALAHAAKQFVRNRARVLRDFFHRQSLAPDDGLVAGDDF